MSQSTKTAFEQLLLSQKSIEEKTPDNSTSGDNTIRTYEQIKGTPFHVVGNEDSGYMAVCGHHKLTENFEKPDEVIGYIQSMPYEVIITLMTIVIEKYELVKNEPNKNVQES